MSFKPREKLPSVAARHANVFARRFPGPVIDNRWLEDMALCYRHIFFNIGFPLPPGIQIYFGKVTNSAHQAEYFYPNRVVVAEHWLDPKQPWKRHRVMVAVVHELCHAAADYTAGKQIHHGPLFAECAKRMGLDREHIPDLS